MKDIGNYLIENDIQGFNYFFKQRIAEKTVDFLDARRMEMSLKLMEEAKWILAFDFKSGDKNKVIKDLKTKFKKNFLGSGSMGKGFDISFNGSKKDLQKIKTYIENSYKKDLNLKYTTFMAESNTLHEDENGGIDHKGQTCDDAHPDMSHEEWEEKQLSELEYGIKEDHQGEEEKKVECPKCKGDGCDHCDGMGYHLDEAFTSARYGGSVHKPKKTNKGGDPRIANLSKKSKEMLASLANAMDTTGGPFLDSKNVKFLTRQGVDNTLEAGSKLNLSGGPKKFFALIKKELGESYLYERFGGDTNIPADKKTTDLIQSGKAKILINVKSALHPSARFVVIQRPLGHKGELRSNQDKVLMATISDPDRGRIKMFAYHGSHISHQKAMDFAKHHKLVAREDEKGNPLYAKESVELDEGIRDFKVGDKVKWVGEDEYENDIEGKDLIGQIGIIKTIKKFGRFHKGDIKFRKKLVKGVVLELDVIKESVELNEDNTAAVAKQVKQAVKKYTTGKLAVQSKGGKTRFIMVRADKIDNELRKKVLNVVAPTANVRDKSNISYGNISDRIISASVEQWMKALGLKESVELDEAGIFDKPRKEYLRLAKAKLGKGKTRTFEFPNNRLASQFAKDMSNSGIATTELVDSTKVQVQMLPGNKSVGKSGLAKYLKKSRGKELNESVISKLQESYTTKIPVDIDINGEILHVTPDISENIIYLHDELNEENQNKLRQLVSKDLKSFVEISKFAGKRNS